MNYKYAYIDESGDTGKSKKSSTNFILAAILINNENTLPHIARKVFRSKIKHKDKVNMLHANANSETVHRSILKRLNNIDYTLLFTNNKDYLVSLDLMLCDLNKNGVIKVYLATRDGRNKVVSAINELGLKYNIEIIQSSPSREKGLQIADFVSWSIFRYLECDDDLYFSKIKKREILGITKPARDLRATL